MGTEKGLKMIASSLDKLEIIESIFKNQEQGEKPVITELHSITPFTYEPAKTKSVLIVADEPLSWNVAKQLIKVMIMKSKYKINLLLSGYALTEFTKDEYQRTFGSNVILGEYGFKTNQHSESHTLIDAINNNWFPNIDTAIVLPSGNHGGEALGLLASKTFLGAKKLYWLCASWLGLGYKYSTEQRALFDDIDAIICNDESAQAVIAHNLPEFTEKILPIGTPFLDTLEIGVGEQIGKETRKRLEIGEHAFVVLYLGDARQDYPNSNPDVVEHSFLSLLIGVMTMASVYDCEFALLWRPHPRDLELKEKLKHLVSESKQFTKLTNLKIFETSNPEFSMNAAAYASDVIASIMSTENFVARARGKKAVFLAFKGDAQGTRGYEELERIYGEQLLDTLKQASSLAWDKTSLSKSLEDSFQDPIFAEAAEGEDYYTHKLLNIFI